jgi:translation initiation factor 1
MDGPLEMTMALVYSTDKGRLCANCGAAKADCRCKLKSAAPRADGPPADGIVRLQRQTNGRAGKAVVVISGLALEPAALKSLAKDLKQRCGCGGAVKDDTIEIQGDHRAALQTALEQLGYKVKLSGG